MDKRVIKTKRNIRKTFMSLLEKKEFHTITVAELARQAEIDRKTFYLHYGNTDELLKEFENDLLIQAQTELNQLDAFDVFMTLEIFNKILNENKIFFRMISRTGLNTFFLKRCEGIIVELLRTQFQEEKEQKKLFDYHLKYIASGVISVYMSWLGNEDGTDLSELSRMISHIIEGNFKKLTTIEKD